MMNTKKEWDKIYTALMGGFEDLNSNEEERSSDEYIPPELKTKQGYSKENNFIVEKIKYTEVSKQGGLLRCSTLPLIREN